MFKKITILLAFFAISISALGRDIYVYFTPSYAALDAIIDRINSAKSSIDVAVYDFTSRPLAKAIIKAKARGVKVRILLDRKANQNKYSKETFLRNAGIDVRLAIPHVAWDREGLMHNKFAVIDGKVVITGSANWTASAFKINDENVIIINRVDIANVYEKEFKYLWKRSLLR
ncbi:phospholipase D family protein [Hippea maritima]|uniref:phospholipase D n=1 Tax=Hippea maritima (strain ATCC 700847 / DSM 10411 / MH2) TaxID=760142 RepID=F2LVW2_HIPMA|nr:phospholipase D family protein [Hippea maritima]AEA33896.1 phospholipase D/Transphosphatidylase [Hippea maritima DSM 10411]